mgnify:CR=1 FL=1
MKLDDDLHKNSSDDKGFKPPPQGITAQNLTTKYVDYSNLTCTRYSNNFQDEEFQAFDSFSFISKQKTGNSQVKTFLLITSTIGDNKFSISKNLIEFKKSILITQSMCRDIR